MNNPLSVFPETVAAVESYLVEYLSFHLFASLLTIFFISITPPCLLSPLFALSLSLSHSRSLAFWLAYLSVFSRPFYSFSHILLPFTEVVSTGKRKKRREKHTSVKKHRTDRE